MRGNSPVQFLGEAALAMAMPYPRRGYKSPARASSYWCGPILLLRCRSSVILWWREGGRMIRHSVLAFLIGLFAAAVQVHAQQPATPHPYPAELQHKLDRAERPTATKGEFRDYLDKRFQVNLPAGAKVENFFAQVGFRAADWDAVIWEYYAKIALTPEHLTGFCKAWRDGPKPKGQSRIYEEDESLPTIGGLPAPAQTPVQVEAWMKAESPWVFCYLNEGRTGAVIMRLSKKT